MPVVLQYHKIRGLAAPARMLLDYGGVPYENKFSEGWHAGGKAKVQEVNALANLPTLFLEDGTVVTQSNAVFYKIGEIAGTNGANDAECSRVDQVISQVMDWRNDMVRTFYSKPTASTFDQHAQRTRANCEKLEKFIARHGYVYSAANRPTTGDFHLFEMIDQNEEFARTYNQPSFVNGYPLLRSIYERFYALPALQGYFNGPLHRLPINSPEYASFGFDADYRKLRPLDGEGAGGPAPEKIKVGYWKIRGLAAPLRMLCSFAGADFESVEYECTGTGSTGFDRSAWNEHGKPPLKALNAMMNLPYVQCGGDLVTQSNACVLYLGRKFGLLGNTPEERAKVHQIMWETSDLRNGAVKQFYKSPVAEEVAAYCDGPAKRHLDKLEHWLQQHGTKFTAAEKVTAADFHVFEMVDQHEEFAKANGQPSFFADGARPHLRAFADRMREHPKMAAYLASPMHKLPVNNRMAGFGASPDYSKLNAYTSQ